jgi:hypothetical protein
VKSASIRPSFLRNTGAISWTVFTCSKRFSIVGCPFLGLEDLGRSQGPVVSQQRVHPVALAVVGKRRLVERPRHIPAPPGELAVGRLGTQATAPPLTEAVFLLLRVVDVEVAADPLAREELLDSERVYAYSDPALHPNFLRWNPQFMGMYNARVSGIMWTPGRIPGGRVLHGMMSHIDVWPTLAAMVGLKPRPHGARKDDNGKPISFDGIDTASMSWGRPASRRT